MKKIEMAKKKLTPAAEIRRIKHWLVDLDAHWSHGTWGLGWRLNVYLPPSNKPGKQHIFYGCPKKTEVAAWRDIERKMKKALEENQ